jgi:hypothetical protein
MRPEIATRPFMFREGQVHLRPLGSVDPQDANAATRASTMTCRTRSVGLRPRAVLLFKGVSTGAMFLSALLWFLGDRSALVGRGGPIVSVIFAIARRFVLVVDSRTPGAILSHHDAAELEVWLARGAFLLTGHSGIARCGVRVLDGLADPLRWWRPLRWPRLSAPRCTRASCSRRVSRAICGRARTTRSICMAQAAAEGSASMLIARSSWRAGHDVRPLALTLALRRLRISASAARARVHASPTRHIWAAARSSAGRTRAVLAARSASAAWRHRARVACAARGFSLPLVPPASRWPADSRGNTSGCKRAIGAES